MLDLIIFIKLFWISYDLSKLGQQKTGRVTARSKNASWIVVKQLGHRGSPLTGKPLDGDMGWGTLHTKTPCKHNLSENVHLDLFVFTLFGIRVVWILTLKRIWTIRTNGLNLKPVKLHIWQGVQLEMAGLTFFLQSWQPSWIILLLFRKILREEAGAGDTSFKFSLFKIIWLKPQ